MSNNITQVDFSSKQVIKKSNHSMEDICDALYVLQDFLSEDLDKKRLDVNNAREVVLHDIENASDEKLESCNSLEVLKKIRALSQERRNLKNLEDCQKVLKGQLKPGVVKHALTLAEQKQKKFDSGGNEVFYENSVKRGMELAKYARLK